jgi:hypothetical protein
MDDLHPEDELAECRQFLAQLESGQLHIRQGGTALTAADTTAAHVESAKAEIAFLESVIARSWSA